jgi:hypothetical protein
MFERSTFIAIIFFSLFIVLLSCPEASLHAAPCLTAGNCCTKDAASCEAIGLQSFPAGDVACQTEWGGTVGKVCCVGDIINSPYGRCRVDTTAVVPPTLPDTVVTPVEEKKLPNFASLIKTEPEEFIGNIVKGLLGLTGTVTVIMMVYGGLLWMTASGNEKAVGQAKQIILWTAIGLVLVFFSYTILSFLFNSLAG